MGAESGGHLHRPWDSELLILEEATRAALVARVRALRDALSTASDVALSDWACTLNCGLEGKRWRLAIVALSLQDAVAKLSQALARLTDPTCERIRDRSGIYFFQEFLAAQGQLAFLFPGEGAQYANMLADLCLHFAEVRATFDLVDRAYIEGGGADPVPSALIFPTGRLADEGLWRMEGAVAAVTTANTALLRLLDRLGVRPQALLGHSTGEYTALQACAVMDVENPVRYKAYVTELRQMYRRSASEAGIPRAMLVAVGIDSATVSTLLASGDGKVYVAMDNCPHQTVIAGPEGAMQRVIAEIHRRGLIYQVLPFDRPYHTPLFAPYARRLGPFFERWLTSPPRIPLYSCTTMARYPSDLEEIRELALQHWVRPVEFRKAIEAMYADGVRVFVEAGPKGNLAAFVDDVLRDRAHLAVAMNVPSRSGIRQLNHALGLLAAQGVPMRLDDLYARRSPSSLRLDAPEEARRHEERSVKLELGLPLLRLSGAEAATRPTHRPVAGQPMLTSGPPAVRTPAVREGVGQWEGWPGATGPAERASGTTEDRGPASAGLGTVLQASGSPLRANGQDEALGRYLRTMERFLDAQEQVMRLFLARNGEAGAPAGSVAPDRSPLASTADDRRVAPLAGASSRQVSWGSAGPSSEGPGCVPGDQGPVPRSAEIEAASETIEDTLLRLVSEKTGYPVDMLGLELDIEAELGVDSIKRVEILGALQRETGAFAADELEEVAGLRTLQAMMDFLHEGAARAPTPLERGSASSGHAARSEAAASPTADPLPFIGDVVSLVPGEAAVVVRRVDLDEDVFLVDHTLGGRVSRHDSDLIALPVMPLTMSMEMLAEAAALLIPDHLVVGMEHVRAHRWIAFDEGSRFLRMVARRQGHDRVRVALSEDTDGAASPAAATPVVEATVCFGDGYPQSPVGGELPLRAERPFRWSPEQLYTEGMFHGPSFRGVVSADRWGEDGAEATLQALPADSLFRSRRSPTFLIDPVLLDAAGQLVGYWATECLSTGFNVFPFQVERLTLYGGALMAPERATCRARIEVLGDTRLRSDIDIIAPDGHVRMRLVGWEDRRFDMPEPFYRLRISPEASLLSTLWPAPLEAYQVDQADVGCWQVGGFAEGFLEGQSMIWGRVLAHLVLSRRERSLWRDLKGPTKRRIQWLLGRVVAKDAVRAYLAHRYHLTLYPADVDIGADHRGRPLAQGAWTQRVTDIPALSVAHSGGVAVAVAGDGGLALGIDIETMGHVNLDDIAPLAFSPQERDLLSTLAGPKKEDWALRLWCAREAVAKALGRGMVGGPRGLEAEQVDFASGTVQVGLRGAMADLFPGRAGGTVVARTLRDGDLIVATCLVERK